MIHYLRYCRTGVLFDITVHVKDQYVTTYDDVILVKPNRIFLSYLTSQNIAVITLKHFFRMSLEGPAIRTAIVTKEKCKPAGREFVSVPV